MAHMFKLTAIAALMGVIGLCLPASAQQKSGKNKSPRIGGYSYSQQDTINTYGDARTRFGGMNTYRDPNLDKQTEFGPFDHGFFFSSGNSGLDNHGGDSPYMN